MTSGLQRANLLIGVDDTDNLSSRGTGFLIQRLIAALDGAGLGHARGATRHQLLVDPRVRYTSHNSSGCIAWECQVRVVEAVGAFCARFLETESAEGSDPGLALATQEVCQGQGVQAALVDFGRQAKTEVLDQQAAWDVARRTGVALSGHGGDRGGVIGALAAVGLHLSGEDGFFLWMPGIRDLLGQATYAGLQSTVPIDAARDGEGTEPSPGDWIDLGDWVRPVLSGGQAVLLLERSGRPGGPWRVAPREVVRTH